MNHPKKTNFKSPLTYQQKVDLIKSNYGVSDGWNVVETKNDFQIAQLQFKRISDQFWDEYSVSKKNNDEIINWLDYLDENDDEDESKVKKQPTVWTPVLKSHLKLVHFKTGIEIPAHFGLQSSKVDSTLSMRGEGLWIEFRFIERIRLLFTNIPLYLKYISYNHRIQKIEMTIHSSHFPACEHDANGPDLFSYNLAIMIKETLKKENVLIKDCTQEDWGHFIELGGLFEKVEISICNFKPHKEKFFLVIGGSAQTFSKNSIDAILSRNFSSDNRIQYFYH